MIGSLFSDIQQIMNMNRSIFIRAVSCDSIVIVVSTSNDLAITVLWILYKEIVGLQYISEMFTNITYTKRHYHCPFNNWM